MEESDEDVRGGGDAGDRGAVLDVITESDTADIKTIGDLTGLKSRTDCETLLQAYHSVERAVAVYRTDSEAALAEARSAVAIALKGMAFDQLCLIFFLHNGDLCLARPVYGYEWLFRCRWISAKACV